ncbi:MAG: cell division protein ZapA [Methylococcaceae bacterium]|nr:cell division protein ZapA [Methylococcaceae bacterium]
MSGNSKKQPVSIKILGKDYKVVCSEEEQETLMQSAQELDEQMRKIRDSGKVTGADRIAVMAALNLTHDLREPKTSPATEEKDIINQLANLRHKIENTLKIQKSS